MAGLKDRILAAKDIKHEDVEIPEWDNVTVRVKGMTDHQLGAYQNRSTEVKAKGSKGGDPEMDIKLSQRRASVVVQCLFDPETDTRIFEDKDTEELAQKNAGTVAGLFTLIQSLSNTDRTFEQQVKDAEGNSSSDQN